MKTTTKRRKHCVCSAQKTCFLGIVFAVIFVASAIFFLMLFCKHKNILDYLNTKMLSATTQEIIQNDGGVSYDLFLSAITEFYTNIIVILTVLIGILSIIGFLYIKHISNKEVVQEVDNVISGEHFKSYLKELIRDNVSKEISEDSDLSDIIEKYRAIEDISKRILFLEKAINSPDKIEINGDNDGRNKTIK